MPSTSNKIILAAFAFAAISTNTASAAKDEEGILGFDEETWTRQFDGPNNDRYDNSMFEGIEKNAISVDELSNRADKLNIDYLNDEFLAAFGGSKEIEDALGRDFQLGLVKLMKNHPANGQNSHKMEDLLGEGVKGGQKPNMADFMSKLNSEYDHIEEDLEIHMSAIESDLRTFDETSAGILNRLIKGDLSEFDAAMETTKRETDKALDADDLEIQFKKANKEMEETDALDKAYEKILNTPEIDKLALRNAGLSEILKNKKNFAKYSKAGNQMFEEATFSAMGRKKN